MTAGECSSRGQLPVTGQGISVLVVEMTIAATQSGGKNNNKASNLGSNQQFSRQLKISYVMDSDLLRGKL